MRQLFLILALPLLLQACKAQNLASEDEQQIRSLRAQSNAAFQQHDIEAILALWTDDIQITTGSGSLLAGKDSIRLFVRQHFEQVPDVKYVRNTEEVLVGASGDIAWERGTWTSTQTRHPDIPEVGGSYAMMWSREKDGWKMKSQLFVWLYGD